MMLALGKWCWLRQWWRLFLMMCGFANDGGFALWCVALPQLIASKTSNIIFASANTSLCVALHHFCVSKYIINKAKPKPIYVNPKSSYFASGNPYAWTPKAHTSLRGTPIQTERARVKGEKSFYSCSVFFSVDIFTFVKYVHERWTRYASLCSNSIYSRFAKYI